MRKPLKDRMGGWFACLLLLASTWAVLWLARIDRAEGTGGYLKQALRAPGREIPLGRPSLSRWGSLHSRAVRSVGMTDDSNPAGVTDLPASKSSPFQIRHPWIRIEDRLQMA